MQSLSKQIRAIGIMTGTSLDGIDLVCADFLKADSGWNFKIIASRTASFSEEVVHQIKAVYTGNAKDLVEAQFDYTNHIAKAVTSFVRDQQLNHVDCVGFHGQTIFHNPKEGYTFQLGNPGVLASLTGQTVIGDFRSQNIALSGEGAPLVPFGDELLFHEYNACINLGGIANISHQGNGKRIGFDACHFNLILNHYAQSLGFDYDRNGELSSSGKVIQPLLDKINQWDYYQQAPPKSLGFETAEQILIPLIDSFNLSPQDALRTWVDHSAEQVARCIPSNARSVLLTGGGTKNTFFTKELDAKTTANIVIPSEQLIDFKEALIFAFLAVLRLREEVNTSANSTGSSRNHVAGGIYLP